MDLPTIQPELYSNDKVTTNGKAICIIGAGPVGLAALKVLLDSSQYRSGEWKTTVFEARDELGGVWLPAPIPPTGEPPESSIYASLTTNIPHPVMAYTSYPFAPSTALFPDAKVVLKYLNDYADHFHLRPHIQFKTTVKKVVWNASRWEVTTSANTVLSFDLVMVCNGHYRIPRYPDTPGMTQWLSSGRASHSATYRHPYDMGDTVLVVGGGPSGQDISAAMCTTARTVIHSVTSATAEDIGNLKRRGRVTHFGDNGRVTFEDGSVETGIDHCILATGYEYSFPFFSEDVLRSAVPSPVPPLPSELYNSTYGVFPLARHLFPLTKTFPSSNLAFLGLLIHVAPFPLVEAQARAVLHAFANPEDLEPMQEAVDIMTRYEELRKKVGDDPRSIAKAWHHFETLEQFEYRDALYKFCVASDGDLNAVWLSAQNERSARVPEWEKEMYCKKILLRKAWKRVEELGKAEEWVKGIGQGGVHEWVNMTKRLEKWYEIEETKSKL
ncbi:Flavin-containing monooxygenase FMO GS-OX-like 4 [Termitomyces sp. T112]|nr:Flavin-containing monooxygenase FMO GS-OX-like 4 [Termitomyces sp. T112]